jgi:anti-sigma B factor antagonist
MNGMLAINDAVRGEWRVLTATGRADIQALDQLDKAIVAAVESSSKVALDLSGVEYMSSAGLRALISGARAAQTRGATFVVCSPVPAVRKVFEISGLASLLKIQEDLPC